MKVLFVCTGNACRSPLADALLKKYRPDIDVESAGTYPYYKVVELTRRYAQKEGVEELLKNVPDGLQSKDLNEYDVIVAMESEHEAAIIRQNPNCADKIEVWHINDPYNQPFKQACHEFDRIKSKVAHMAKSIKQ
ncbi:MAG: low molecular weight phosphatase family protein [Candidatus Bathyarchaeota archaeon]|nr:low molecular weight phosphatase family protein [Candidatus Bathyarchaeota archaeon]